VKLFEGYDASTDLPACIYWREMMAAFPNAKVILIIRDAESRWKSYESLVGSQQGPIDRLSFLPRFEKLNRLTENIERVFFKIEPDQYVAEDVIKVFNEHNEAVKATVPADRL
jgi:hypothetical protein